MESFAGQQALDLDGFKAINDQYTHIADDQLMRQADQAMYRAKQSGKNRFQFFDAEHDHRARG